MEQRGGVRSGALPGSRELRDLAQAFGGKAVTNAIGHGIGEIAGNIRGRDAKDQLGLDEAMVALDGTSGKSRLGANAILGVSMAAARAAAIDNGQQLWRCLGGPGTNVLPVPWMNVLNGGVHADNPVDCQEFMIAPLGATSLSHAVHIGSEMHPELQRTLKRRGPGTAVGDEGGFAPGSGVGLAEAAESALGARLLPDHMRGSGFGLLGVVQSFGELRVIRGCWPALERGFADGGLSRWHRWMVLATGLHSADTGHDRLMSVRYGPGIPACGLSALRVLRRIHPTVRRRFRSRDPRLVPPSTKRHGVASTAAAAFIATGAVRGVRHASELVLRSALSMIVRTAPMVLA